jgi:hypothetical protein
MTEGKNDKAKSFQQACLQPWTFKALVRTNKTNASLHSVQRRATN